MARDLQQRHFRVFEESLSEGFVGCVQAAQNEMKGILAVSDVPLVSRDFALTDVSTTIDSSLTMVMVCCCSLALISARDECCILSSTEMCCGWAMSPTFPQLPRSMERSRPFLSCEPCLAALCLAVFGLAAE